MVLSKKSSQRPKRRKKYVPAVGPRLKRLLFVVFGLFALLAVNSFYLASVTLLEWGTGQVYQNWFYLLMFLVHLGLGLAIVLPLIGFGFGHLWNAYNRPNRRAVRVGIGLFTTALLLLASGVALTRVELSGMILGVRDPATRSLVYWIHVISPLVAIWLFVLHRLAGRRIKWRVGLTWAGVAAGFALVTLLLHSQDPRSWNVAGNPRGEQYFFPSLSRTVTGNFIPAESLDNNDYCRQCHSDIHQSWSHSVHRFASFNNPAYFATVRETRKAVFERDGTVVASRFCAGCHDPVPFFSGEFDEPRFDSPDYDLASDPMANAGITCSVCHSISHINSPRGNADYTIDEPAHYPFAFSRSAGLAWLSQQLVKAKPEFHKKTFLKPLHKTTEFCGTCHKVHLPKELNAYKWLRGQNHQDSFWLSGVSGQGVASFYYPAEAEPNCNRCHMPTMASQDFGAKLLDDSGQLKVHDHQFPSANTAIPYLLGMPEEVIEAHRRFNEGVMRVDIFGVRKEGRIDGELSGALRPQLPFLEPGRTYLIETVIRTLKMGHIFTQGTADSNEVWLDVTVRDGGRVLGRMGGVDADGAVDPWSHFVNAYVIDREGNRIDRRNAQDIFVPLYDHQIPPGAADVVHLLIDLPRNLQGPVTIEAKLRYRKFDTTYMRFFQAEDFRANTLPVMTLATDRVTLPVKPGQAVSGQETGVPAWERWNDYGIGLLRRGQLRQAEEAFLEVETRGRPDGPLNAARVYLAEGLIQTHAPEALGRAGKMQDPAANPWTLLWLSGLVNQQNGDYDAAIANFGELVKGGFAEAGGRNFDFSKDYRLLAELGRAYYQRARQERGQAGRVRRDELLNEASRWFESALLYDPENLEAHWGLKQVFNLLGDSEREKHHSELHAIYKPDDNARDQAIAAARRKNPAANHAAEQVVIYDLRREGRFPGDIDEWKAESHEARE